MATNGQGPTSLLRIQHDDQIHPLNHTRRRREALKRELPPEKFEELMNLARIDGMLASCS